MLHISSFVSKTLQVKGFQTHPLCCLFGPCWASHTSQSLCAVRVTRHTPVGFFSLSQEFSVYVWPPVFKWWLFSASLTKNSHSHFLYTPPRRNKSVSWLIETLSCQSSCFVPSLPHASLAELRRCREVIKLQHGAPRAITKWAVINK